ncbi:MAG TPA: AAA family ATPase, partial [bacterium]|nr:AAA family ATPase [bacterium]
MKKIVVASTHKSAGKTSLIVGLAKASKGDFAYVKPFGDRLLYRKKRLWDYDAALMAKIFDIKESPEEMSIGFEHAKLRFIYDEKSIKEKVIEKAGEVSKDKKVLFVEGGSDIKYGASVHLDSLSVLRYLDAGLVLVVGGDEYSVLDDIVFVKEYIDSTKLKFEGIIINNIRDVEDFKATHLDTIKKAGVDILGIIPHRPELTHISVRLLVDRMFARVISGEGGLDKVVKNVFVGAMSVSSALQDPLFEKEGKLIIT